jgi:hypothetical protein
LSTVYCEFCISLGPTPMIKVRLQLAAGIGADQDGAKVMAGLFWSSKLR